MDQDKGQPSGQSRLSFGDESFDLTVEQTEAFLRDGYVALSEYPGEPERPRTALEEMLEKKAQLESAELFATSHRSTPELQRLAKQRQAERDAGKPQTPLPPPPDLSADFRRFKRSAVKRCRSELQPILRAIASDRRKRLRPVCQPRRHGRTPGRAPVHQRGSRRSTDASRDGPGEPESDLDSEGEPPRHISAVLRRYVASLKIVDDEEPPGRLRRFAAILRAGPVHYFRDWLVARRIGREVFGR